MFWLKRGTSSVTSSPNVYSLIDLCLSGYAALDIVVTASSRGLVVVPAGRNSPTRVWNATGLRFFGLRRQLAGLGVAVGGFVRPAQVGLAEDGLAPGPGHLLQALREVHGVADERVLEALLRAEEGGGCLAARDADPEQELLPRRILPRLVERVLRAVHRERGLHRPSQWSACGNGAPKTAMTASPTNCITVPPAPRMASFIAARCSLSWAARWVGAVRSAIDE